MKSLTIHSLAAQLVFFLPALMLASCGQTPAPSKSPLEGQLTTQALPANGTYKLLNVLSGKVMDVSAGSLENGANIQQFEDNGTDAQRWVFSRNTDNSYTVTNLKSKKVLDIEGGTTENGARAQQWVDSSGTNQHFDLTDLGNSVVSLTAKHSAKVVEVSNSSRDNGGRVQQWDWANVDSQKWKLVPVSGLPNSGLTPLPSKKLPSGLYKMAFNYSKSVLEVVDGAAQNGDPIGEGTDTGLNSSRQLWNFVVQSDGSYTIKNLFSGKVMDVSEVSLERGAKIHQWDDYGNANQRFDVFVYSDANSNTVSTRISARHSGRAVVIPKGTASSFSSSTQAAQDYVFGATDAPHDYVVVWDLTKVSAAPTPTPTPTPAPQQFVWWRGVNLAGADFADEKLPGEYVKDYFYPNQAEVDYFSGKGMNVFRFPILWERVQRSQFAEFNPEEIARVDKFVNETTGKGKIVVLDPHNYARYYKQLIGSSAVPSAAFADLWRRLALRYKGNDKVVFGLMNEPHNINTGQWVDAANAAIRAIRDTGSSNLILVPGTRWTGAWTWFAQDGDGEANATALLRIVDPLDKTWFEVHQYLDTYASGTEDPCVSATIGSERLKVFTKWLEDHGKKGFLGEFSSGKNAQCDAALEDMLRYVEDHGDVWRGWTYWAAGPYWPAGTSLEPNNGTDARQMPILSKFLPR